MRSTTSSSVVSESAQMAGRHEFEIVGRAYDTQDIRHAAFAEGCPREG